jgi:hypothetical protein
MFAITGFIASSALARFGLPGRSRSRLKAPLPNDFGVLSR